MPVSLLLFVYIMTITQLILHILFLYHQQFLFKAVTNIPYLFLHKKINPFKNHSKMQVQLTSIRLKSRKQSPHFVLSSQPHTFPSNTIVAKVLAFSLDPVMRIWLSGAKTNFRVVKEGDIFNCFGVAQIIETNDQEYYPLHSYLFGNTGTTNFFEFTDSKKRQCFPIDQSLIQDFGPDRFLYLINNGLAAFQGFQILNPKQNETVLVSTAAGATGLLLCHLLKKRKADIVALCSDGKRKYVGKYTDKIINYKNRQLMKQQLQHLKYSKYFDNVGESQLDLVLSTIQNHGTLALCGAIEGYLQPKEGGISNLTQVIFKRLKLEGINFSSLIYRSPEIFENFKDAELAIHRGTMAQFIPLFEELFKSGGSIVGKVIIDPHQ